MLRAVLVVDYHAADRVTAADAAWRPRARPGVGVARRPFLVLAAAGERGPIRDGGAAQPLASGDLEFSRERRAGCTASSGSVRPLGGPLALPLCRRRHGGVGRRPIHHLAGDLLSHRTRW